MGRLGWAPVWVAVVACGSGRLDSDRDGFESQETGGVDCDDRRPDVHPGALEIPGGRLESSVILSGEMEFAGGDWLTDAAIVDGTIAVLYWQGPDLIVARPAGSEWSREVVGSAENGGQRRARLAPDGSVHEVWRLEEGGLRHASNSSGEWSEEPIPDSLTAGDRCVTFEADGSVVVVFTRASNGLSVARRAADAAWSVRTPTNSPVDEIAQCALDGSGRAHVMDLQGNANGYVIEDADSWQVESPPKLGPFALDASGAAHIAAGLDGLTYVTNAGGEWRSEHVSGEIMDEFPTAVAVAPAGTIHVLTVRREAMYDQSDVTYTRRDGIWAGPVPVALSPALGNAFLLADDGGLQIVDMTASPIGESQWDEEVQIRVTRSVPYDEDCDGVAE